MMKILSKLAFSRILVNVDDIKIVNELLTAPAQHNYRQLFPIVYTVTLINNFLCHFKRKVSINH